MALFGRPEHNGTAAGLGKGWTEGANCRRATAVGRMAGVLLVSGGLVVALGHQLMALGSQVAENGRHIDVLLDGGAYQAAVKHFGQRFHLVSGDHCLIDQIDLILDNHRRYLIALVLHLALPILDRLERGSICRGEDQHGGLGSPVVGLGDAVKLLLSGGVPQHNAHILAVDLDLALQEIHTDCLLVVLCEYALAVALDHR